MSVINEVIPKVENPCTKDCPERSITCHSECKRYFKFQDYNRRMKELKDKIANLYNYKGKKAQV